MFCLQKHCIGTIYNSHHNKMLLSLLHERLWRHKYNSVTELLSLKTQNSLAHFVVGSKKSEVEVQRYNGVNDWTVIMGQLVCRPKRAVLEPCVLLNFKLITEENHPQRLDERDDSKEEAGREETRRKKKSWRWHSRRKTYNIAKAEKLYQSTLAITNWSRIDGKIASPPWWYTFGLYIYLTRFLKKKKKVT